MKDTGASFHQHHEEFTTGDCLRHFQAQKADSGGRILHLSLFHDEPTNRIYRRDAIRQRKRQCLALCQPVFESVWAIKTKPSGGWTRHIKIDLFSDLAESRTAFRAFTRRPALSGVAGARRSVAIKKTSRTRKRE